METINNTKLCLECNQIRKFNMRINKAGLRVMTGKNCIACKSTKNNMKLREKNYYKEYYENNMETFKQRDRVRYQRLKQLNTVSFDIVPPNSQE